MSYESELQRLQRLLHTDYKAYLDELDKPWSSMDEDLDLAIKILLKHASNSGGRLPLLEACYFPAHSSPHFAPAVFGMNTPAFDTASAKFCSSGTSLCSGMLGMRS
jgi:hypothetical protein